MAYKYLNDNGLKAYTKKVKGALKDLHTPIAISTLNTTESNAQNVRNIADFVAKAKAAGITDVDGMAVTCLLSSGYSGVGYLHFVDGNYTLQGVEIQEELERSTCFLVWDDGSYKKTNLITGDVTSQDLTQGARKPIIFTPSTTEADEETYQKLLIDDVDVIFKGDFILHLEDIDRSDPEIINLYFTGRNIGVSSADEVLFSSYTVSVTKSSPHNVSSIEETNNLQDILDYSGYLNKSTLSPVLQEIDLTGTDAERKAKLIKFEKDWKAFTGASDMTGARFVGYYSGESSDPGNNETVLSAIMVYDSNEGTYKGFTIDDSGIIRKVDLGSDGNFGAYNLFSDVAAIKYSYTPVPLTATTSTNKTQLDLFLSKVPNAQVMHVTYKDVYAGTLHKIGTDWFGLLVKNTNNYEDALQVKLQADGTLIEGTTSLAQVNAKLANIIG